MKNKYQSPTIKVVEFKVERGFQASGFQGNTNTTTGLMEFQMEFDADGPCNEQYESHTINDFWD